MRVFVRLLPAVFAVLMLVGCSAAPHTQPSGSPAGGSQQITPGTPISDPPAPSTMTSANFKLVDVEAALKAAGLSPRVTGAKLPGEPFGVPGSVLSTGTADVQVYVFADAADRAKTQVSPDGFTVRRGNTVAGVDWITPPRVIARGNLWVLVITKDSDLADRIVKAVEGMMEG